MTPPLLLALEFSSNRRSVALVQAGKVLAESVQDLGRSTRVFSLIKDTLNRAGRTPKSVDALALGIGPGSYTGIRLAISVVQGWCLATERRVPIRVIPVSSFEVLAATIEGSAWLASDAQREEWAVTRVHGGQIMEPAKLVSARELIALAQTERVVGPEVVDRLGVGETGFAAASELGLIAATRSEDIAPEALAPVYLRSAAFVKAPVPRFIAGITDGH